MIEDSDSVVECHGLDVERGEDGLLVRQSGVIVGRDLGREMLSAGGEHLLTLAESMTHMSQRLTFTDLRSALLSGEPWSGY